MVADLAKSARRECLDDVLPWWFRHGVDDRQGGIFSMMTDTGERLGTDKFVWSQARWLWTMSAAYNRLEPRPEFAQAAEQTAKFLLRHGRGDDGRWHYRVTEDGVPVEGPISIYSDFFAVYGLSEYFRLSGDQEALAVANVTFEQISERVDQPDFVEIAPYKVRPGLRPHGVQMMMVETANELSITLGGSADVDAMAALAMERILTRFVQPDSNLVVEFLGREFEAAPAPEGTLIVPGHAIEGMWFLAHFARRTKRLDLLEKITQVTLTHLEYGWDRDFGGIVLNRDLHGQEPYFPHGDKKIWWPHSEAIYTLALLASLDPSNVAVHEWLERVHQWTYAHFPMPGGEWRQRLDRRGHPIQEVIALPVKDPFHLPRALILLSQLSSKDL
jgi:N-acylglucosamine 2-epimerase